MKRVRHIYSGKVYLTGMYSRGFNQEIIAKRLGCVISGEVGEREYQEFFRIKGYRNKYTLNMASQDIIYPPEFYEIPHKYIGFHNPLIKRKVTSPLGGFFDYSRRFIDLMDSLGFKDYRTEPVWVYLVDSPKDLDLHHDELIQKYEPHIDLFVHMRITSERINIYKLEVEGQFESYEFPLFFVSKAKGSLYCNTVAAQAIRDAGFRDVGLYGDTPVTAIRQPRKLKRTWRTDRGFIKRRQES
jgi:hypothetical protein